MIKQLHSQYAFSKEELDCIKEAKNNWGSQKNCIGILKDLLNTHFDTLQGDKCCFCGLLYNRTGRGEIEHIAPKGESLYPQFSYHRNNLAKACQLCNSSSMKHTYDSVAVLDPVYENCQFKIVHPYLDDHSQHYKFGLGLLKVTISVVNNSPQAIESIGLFELASEKRTKARATQRNQERLENIYNISLATKKRIKDAISFRLF